MVVVVAMVLGNTVIRTDRKALMGEGKQGFQYIQEYTGFVSPGIFAMFILGFFWKKATIQRCIVCNRGWLYIPCFFKLLPRFADLSFLAPYGFFKLACRMIK